MFPLKCMEGLCKYAYPRATQGEHESSGQKIHAIPIILMVFNEPKWICSHLRKYGKGYGRVWVKAMNPAPKNDQTLAGWYPSIAPYPQKKRSLHLSSRTNILYGSSWKILCEAPESAHEVSQTCHYNFPNSVPESFPRNFSQKLC